MRITKPAATYARNARKAEGRVLSPDGFSEYDVALGFEAGMRFERSQAKALEVGPASKRESKDA